MQASHVQSAFIDPDAIDQLASDLNTMTLNSKELLTLIKADNLFGIGPKICKMLEKGDSLFTEEDLLVALYLLLQHGVNNADAKPIIAKSLMTLAYKLSSHKLQSLERLTELSELFERRSSMTEFAQVLERPGQEAPQGFMTPSLYCALWSSFARSFNFNGAVEKLELESVILNEALAPWIESSCPTGEECKVVLLLTYYMCQSGFQETCELSKLSQNPPCLKFMRQAEEAVPGCCMTPATTPRDPVDLTNICRLLRTQKKCTMIYLHRLSMQLAGLHFDSEEPLKECLAALLGCTWCYSEDPVAVVLETSASKLSFTPPSSPTIKQRKWVRAENPIFQAYSKSLEELIMQKLEPLVIRCYGTRSGETAAAVDAIKRKCVYALLETMQRRDLATKVELSRVIFTLYKLIQDITIKAALFDELVMQLPALASSQVKYTCDQGVYSLNLCHPNNPEEILVSIQKPRVKGALLHSSLSSITF